MGEIVSGWPGIPARVRQMIPVRVRPGRNTLHSRQDSVMASRRRRGSRPLRGLAGPRAEKTVSLALQGGGAHGAFTWGVLDALLEDGRLAIEAITGASAGALNAVVMVEGWLEGGIDGARSALETFWRRASVDGSLSRAQRWLLSRPL